jgi:hypothetical protein
MKYDVTVSTPGGGHRQVISVDATGTSTARDAAVQIAQAQDAAARGSTTPPRTWVATDVKGR